MNTKTLDRRVHELERQEVSRHIRFVMAHPGVDVEAEIAKIEAEDPDAEVRIFRWLPPDKSKGLRHAYNG